MRGRNHNESRIIANARPRSDSERRAMFARLRGGASSKARGGASTYGTMPTDWKERAVRAPDAPTITPSPEAQAARDRGRRAEYLDRPEWRAGEYSQSEWESLPTYDRQRLSMVTGVPTFAPMPAAAAATPAAALLKTKAAKNALASLLTGLSSAGIEKYRESNPTMDPDAERGLAKLSALFSTISALTGLASAKGTVKGMGSFTKADLWLGDKGRKLATIARRATAGVPAPVKTVAAGTHKAYSAVADFTGGTVTDLLNLPTVAANLRSADPAKAREALIALAKAGTIVAGAAAIEGYEAAKIADYREDIAAHWDAGLDYELAPDKNIITGPLSLAAVAALGSLGNPIERQFRSYYGGKYTKDLADYAAYSLQHDRIGEMEKAGVLSPESAEAAREKNAEWKPWNMAGRSVYTFSPAAANFLKWKVGDFLDAVAKPIQVGRVEQVHDADTIVLKDGNAGGVRFTGIDAPEVAKPQYGKEGDYLGEESKAWQTAELLGRVVRIVQNPEAMTDKYGRTLGYVETLPRPFDNLLLIPGLNRILPAIDQNKKTILEGFAQPNAGHVRLPGGRHERRMEYDAAVLDARERGVGIQSPEGFEKYQPERPYTPKPPKDETLLDRVSLYLGLGLMTSGQSGVFKALEGERLATRTSPAIAPSGTGGVLAQAWNAGPALAAAYEYYAGGTSNTGRVYRLPKNYATDYELKVK